MSTTRNAGHHPHHAGGGAGDHLGDTGDQGAVTALLGHLDTWDKLLVVAGAVSRNHQLFKQFILTIDQVAALGLAVFLLVCCVGEGCLLHDVITSRRSELKSKTCVHSSKIPFYFLFDC